MRSAIGAVRRHRQPRLKKLVIPAPDEQEAAARGHRSPVRAGGEPVCRGRLVARPEYQRAMFRGLTAVLFGKILMVCDAGVWPPSYPKQVRGPKCSRPERVSVAKTRWKSIM